MVINTELAQVPCNAADTAHIFTKRRLLWKILYVSYRIILISSSKSKLTLETTKCVSSQNIFVLLFLFKLNLLLRAYWPDQKRKSHDLAILGWPGLKPIGNQRNNHVYNKWWMFQMKVQEVCHWEWSIRISISLIFDQSRISKTLQTELLMFDAEYSADLQWYCNQINVNSLHKSLAHIFNNVIHYKHFIGIKF